MSDRTAHRNFTNIAYCGGISFLISEEHDDIVQTERTEKSHCWLISYTSECSRMYRLILFSVLELPVTEFILGRDSGEVGLLSVLLSIPPDPQGWHLTLSQPPISWCFRKPLCEASSFFSYLPRTLHLSPLLLLLCSVAFLFFLGFWPGCQLLRFTRFYAGECFQSNQAEKDCEENSWYWPLGSAIYKIIRHFPLPRWLPVGITVFLKISTSFFFLSGIIKDPLLLSWVSMCWAPKGKGRICSAPGRGWERRKNVLAHLIANWILSSS